MCTFCFCIHEKVKGHYDQCAMLALLCSMQQQACFADKAAVLVDNKALFLLCTSSQEGAQYCRLFVCSKKKRRLDSVHIIVVVCAVPFSRFDLFAAVVDKNDVTDQARSIKRGVSRRIEDFFCTGLAAQNAHFRQKKGFYRLSETPFFILLATRLLLLRLRIRQQTLRELEQ